MISDRVDCFAKVDYHPSQLLTDFIRPWMSQQWDHEADDFGQILLWIFRVLKRYQQVRCLVAGSGCHVNPSMSEGFSFLLRLRESA